MLLIIMTQIYFSFILTILYSFKRIMLINYLIYTMLFAYPIQTSTLRKKSNLL